MLNSLKNQKSIKVSILFINYWLLGKLKHFNLFNKSLCYQITDNLPVAFAICDKGRQEAIALFLRISLENKRIALETTTLTNTVFQKPWSSRITSSASQVAGYNNLLQKGKKNQFSDESCC